MSISTYKRWMKESYLYEADDDKVIGKNDKGDPVTVRQALDFSSDNPTMVKLKKKAQDLSDKDKGGEEEPKAEPKKTAISKTGGFGGDTGTDADFQGDPPEGTREPDDTAGDPEDAWDDEEGRAKPTGKTDADAWEDDPVGGDNSVNEGSMDWEKHFKGYNEKELKVISKFIWMNPQGIDGVIKMSKKKDFKLFVQKAAKKGLGESLTIKESVNKRIAVKEVQTGKAKQIDKKLESVTEGKYHDYRNDESLSPKQKIGYSMREVRDKLNELDKLVKMNVRLKNEIGVDSTSYWKRTHGAMKKISERLVKLANKVGQLY